MPKKRWKDSAEGGFLRSGGGPPQSRLASCQRRPHRTAPHLVVLAPIHVGAARHACGVDDIGGFDLQAAAAAARMGRKK